MSDTFKGMLLGIGLSAVAFAAYKKNEDKVHDFLKEKGVPIKTKPNKDYYSMTLDELFEEKETIEDVIAERELYGDADFDMDFDEEDEEEFETAKV